mmetsp:Transcript_791/g.2363  ORF Transcript_791/g.2363 Transcript_791/m.2363 type:complete len:122 (-) Transcript_791:160-525(-)
MLRSLLTVVLVVSMADISRGEASSDAGPLAALKDVLQHGLHGNSDSSAGGVGDVAPPLKELKANSDGNATQLDESLSAPENPDGTIVRVTLNSELQESEAQTSSDARRVSNLRQAQAGSKL